MELKPNMYVRTKKGIFQIRNKDVFIEDKKQYIGVNGRYTCIDIEIIEKASHNIIDLIEVGDYVNGYKISSIYDDDSEVNEYDLKHKKCLGKNIYDEDYQEYLIYEEDIKSIVTKEQFEVMQYKVGE